MSGPRGEKSGQISLALTVAAFVMSVAATVNVFSVGNEKRLSTLETEMRHVNEQLARILK